MASRFLSTLSLQPDRCSFSMEGEACESACFLRLSNFAPVGTYARQREVPIRRGIGLSFEKFSAIFGWTSSAQLTKDPRKMLLSFESASHSDIQYAQFCLAQDLFRALGSAT